MRQADELVTRQGKLGRVGEEVGDVGAERHPDHLVGGAYVDGHSNHSSRSWNTGLLGPEMTNVSPPAATTARRIACCSLVGSLPSAFVSTAKNRPREHPMKSTVLLP